MRNAGQPHLDEQHLRAIGKGCEATVRVEEHAPRPEQGNGLFRSGDDLLDRFEWTEMTYLQVKAGNIAVLIFGLGRWWCTWCWRRRTRTGGCRWP